VARDPSDEERMAFISDWQRQVRCDPQRISMAELCRHYGVSRRCGYALVERYEALGQTTPAEHYTSSGRPTAAGSPSPSIQPTARSAGSLQRRDQVARQPRLPRRGPDRRAHWHRGTDDELFIVSYGPIELGWLDNAANFTARRSGLEPRPSPQPQPPG